MSTPMSPSQARTVLETRLADTAEQIEKLKQRLAILAKKKARVNADQATLNEAMQALVAAEAELEIERRTNPGTPATKVDLTMAENRVKFARETVLEADEQLRLEKFGFKLKWTDVTLREFAEIAMIRLPTLRALFVKLQAELELVATAERAEIDRLTAIETRKVEQQRQLEAELKAKRERAQAIAKQRGDEERARLAKERAAREAKLARDRELARFAENDDPLFAALAKAPTKPMTKSGDKTEKLVGSMVDHVFTNSPTGASRIVRKPAPVVPETLEEVLVAEPVVEVAPISPPVPVETPKATEEPTHPVLALFQNWQERHGHVVSHGRPLPRAFAGAQAK